MKTEIWEDIPGYEGRYQVSSLGRIKSLEREFIRHDWRTGLPTLVSVRERILKAGRFNRLGHFSVFLRDEKHPNGIGVPVHKIVMLTFVGEPPVGTEVLHINSNPVDNQLTNLRYGTRSENQIDRYRFAGGGLKLSTDDVIEIRKQLERGRQQRQIAKQFGVSDTTIYYIKSGRRFEWL
jgi:hypothetical protein